jgi:pimeloyl-ACP methyl ester carboxylesterase
MHIELAQHNAKVYYEKIGEGRPLVILHALAFDHRMMKAWIEPLFENRPGWQRIYLDMPAHGLTEAKGLHSSDDIHRILLDAIDQLLPNQRFALCGMSFGGYIAQGLFHHRHARIDGLCLLAPRLHRIDGPTPARTVLTRDEALLAGLEPELRTSFETLMVHQTRETWHRYETEILPGRQLRDLPFLAHSGWREHRYFLTFDPLPAEAVYHHPTLLLLGRQDAICGYEPHFHLLRHFPRATYAILDGAGHMLQIEQRKTVQALFIDWLNRVE